MTEKEKMIQYLYKAFAEGAGKLFKYGAAFTVLVLCILGLIWALAYVVNVHDADRKEWKSELVGIRLECSNKVNLLETRIYECNEMRALLAARVAALEEAAKYKKR